MKWVLLIFSLAVFSSQAQTIAPTNAWYPVFTPLSSALSPINGAWNGLTYSPDANLVYVVASSLNYQTPWENELVSYANPKTCGSGANQPCQNVPTNPWKTVSDAGTRSGLYKAIQTNVTLGGISACNGTTVLSGSTTIAMNVISNTTARPTAGAFAIENEVIDYGSIVSGNSTACIVYGTLTRGSRGTTAASHTATAAPGNLAQYTPPASPTAAEFLAVAGTTGGMLTDVGSGLAATTDVPIDRHPARTLAYDKNAKRLLMAGGYFETRPLADDWSLCIFGAGSATSDCPTGNSSTPGSILYGWTRLASANQYTGHQESMGVYDTDHDAYYLFGGNGPTNDMWVKCLHITGSSPATCNGLLTWQHVTPSCSGTCPQRQAGQMRYDPDDHVIVQFGGGQPTNGNITILIYAPTATNTLSQAANSWVVKSSPPGITTSNCCRFPAFAYDTLRHKGVFYFNTDVLFTYDVPTDAWLPTSVLGGPPTSPSTTGVQVNLVYNSVDDKFVFMSNLNGTGNNVLTTWELPGAAISSPVVTIYPRITRGATIRR